MKRCTCALVAAEQLPARMAFRPRAGGRVTRLPGRKPQLRGRLLPSPEPAVRKGAFAQRFAESAQILVAQRIHNRDGDAFGLQLIHPLRIASADCATVR